MERSPSADALFRSVYASHIDAIRLYCIRRMPLSEVDDATSEVFLVLWRKIDVAPRGDAAHLWLYGVARKVVANQRRSTMRFTNLKVKASVVISPVTRSMAPRPSSSRTRLPVRPSRRWTDSRPRMQKSSVSGSGRNSPPRRSLRSSAPPLQP